MALNRGGRMTGIVFAILGLAVGLSPAMKIYRRATGESEEPMHFDSVDAALLGLGAALVVLCIYFLVRRSKPG